jgi:hypothetical protein
MGNEPPSPTLNAGEPVYVVAPGLPPAQLQQSLGAHDAGSLPTKTDAE